MNEREAEGWRRVAENAAFGRLRAMSLLAEIAKEAAFARSVPWLSKEESLEKIETLARSANGDNGHQDVEGTR